MKKPLSPTQHFIRKTLSSLIPLAKYRRKFRRKWLHLDKIQSFTPTPSTITTVPTEKNYNLDSDCYIPKSKRFYEKKESDAKLIAFYLPQFHPFPENNLWWGENFTEWTNVTKSAPQYRGQYQPHLPVEVGFYDLTHPDVMFKQVELAKQYGISGFCFHYYWFSGKRLMERPIFNYLEEKKLDLPFCLCWANEPWSRRWDGSENEILMPQNFSQSEIDLFYNDIRDFLLDSRYIKVDNKPVVIIYRPHFFEKKLILKALKRWREMAINDGFNGIYALCAESHVFKENPEDWGFDGAVEFPPHNCFDISDTNLQALRPDFRGNAKHAPEVIEHIFSRNPSYTLFRTASPGWDNTARKLENCFSLTDLTPEVYQDWLSRCIKHALTQCPSNAPFAFVNAWNEWAEGAHLEPDRKYGFGYLEATRNALETTHL